MPEPYHGRGTISLLWLCLSTCFFCLYTTIHHDPGYDSSDQVARLILGPVVPEWTCGGAMMQWTSARVVVRLCGNLDAARVPLSTKQAFWLSTGGVVFTSPSSGSDWGPKYTAASSKKIVLAMFALQHAQGKAASEEHALAQEIYEKLRSELATDEQLDLRSKSNFVSKFVPFCQIIWFAIQVVARLGYRLDISIAEILTMTFVAITLIAYPFWFHKPYNIAEPQFVEVPTTCIEAITQDRVERGEEVVWQSSGLHRSMFNTRVTSMMLVNAFGLVAWNHDFTHSIVARIYRTITVVAVVVPGLWVPFQKISHLLHANDRFDDVRGWLFLSFCICSRLFLLAIAIYDLTNAPIGVYTGLAWASYLPHIGS